jgi:hypothetical protein
MNEIVIESYSKCACGAITIFFTNGASNSMRPATAKNLGIDLRHYKRLTPTCCCDHCVNHWGIDLCECGSGEKVGKCSCGSKKAHDNFGIKFNSFAALCKAFN